MTTQRVTTPGYTLVLESSPPLLRVTVSGGEDTSFPVTADYWLRIAAEVRATGARQLLFIDDMQGEVMTDADLQRFFDSIHGTGLEQARIAYVESRMDQIQRIEIVEQMALERGYHVRIFTHEPDALVWLRHGGEEA